MKFNSLSLAKTALLLSLAIGSTSAWFAWQTMQDLPALRQSVAQADKKAAEATATRAELEALPAVKGELRPIDVALSSFMLDLMNSRVRYGIEVSQSTPAKPAGGEQTAVGDLAEELPGTKLKSMRVDLGGTYSDYERFGAFLRHVQAMEATSIVRLQVKGDTYALSVRIHGKS